VNQRETAGIALEIFEWVLAADGNPAQIHLHLHQLGVALFQENVVREFPVDGRKFKPMIVIGELDSRLLARLAGSIEGFARALPAVGLLPNLVINIRVDQVFVTDHVGSFQYRRPLFP